MSKNSMKLSTAFIHNMYDTYTQHHMKRRLKDMDVWHYAPINL